MVAVLISSCTVVKHLVDTSISGEYIHVRIYACKYNIHMYIVHVQYIHVHVYLRVHCT